MSRLRRPFLYDRFIFVTVKLLSCRTRLEDRDFERLHARFGVDWLVLEQPGVFGLDCPYQNDSLRVCRVGGSK